MMRFLRSNLVVFLGRIFCGYCFTIVMFWLYAILIVKTNLSDQNMVEGVYVITLLGAGFVGSLCAFQKKVKGWILGGKGGGTYGLILIGVNYIFNNFLVDWGKSLIFLILTFIFGMVGGIIGVNRKLK
jgi:putative membrane protein (TIGR04086 family)